MKKIFFFIKFRPRVCTSLLIAFGCIWQWGKEYYSGTQDQYYERTGTRLGYEMTARNRRSSLCHSSYPVPTFHSDSLTEPTIPAFKKDL